MGIYVRPYSVAITYMDERTALVTDVNTFAIVDGVLVLTKEQMVNGVNQSKDRGFYPLNNVRRWIRVDREK